MSDADLKLVRVFKTVVERGGFTAAAPILGISRSSVSLYMANLETRLGLTLCQRGRSGFVLTEAGKEVYEASMRLLSAIEAFRTEINDFHAELRGELNIGITDNLVTLPQMRVSDSLSAVKRRGPQVRINIHMGPSGDIERGVIDGRFQVGVVPAIKRVSALNYIPLYNETSYLYCATNHPLFGRKDESIGAEEITSYDAVQPLFPLSSSAQKKQSKLKGTATATDREGVAFLVLTGEYVGYLPRHFARRWVQGGRLRTIQAQDHHYEMRYSLVTRRGHLLSRVLEYFLGQIRETR